MTRQLSGRCAKSSTAQKRENEARQMTPREIIAAYTHGREFAYPHSAEEYLAMAYNDMAKQLSEARAAQREAEAKVESAVHRLAVEVAQFKDGEVLPHPHDPTVWRLHLEPALWEFRMLSADPANWHPEMIDRVARAVGEALGHKIVRRLHKERTQAQIKSKD
jgi:hypothetical protein